MKGYSENMQNLIAALGRLPAIGKRSAERILFYLLKTKPEEVRHLADLLVAVKEHTQFCSVCNNFSDQDVCHICRDPGRDRGLICVVEDPKDVIAIEKTGNYVGVYHVLLGFLSALEGIGPNELAIQALLERIEKDNVREVIFATNPSTEGETTALYIARLLKAKKVKLTRLAQGVSVGSMIEYTDQATLSRALEGRVSV